MNDYGITIVLNGNLAHDQQGLLHDFSFDLQLRL